MSISRTPKTLKRSRIDSGMDYSPMTRSPLQEISNSPKKRAVVGLGGTVSPRGILIPDESIKSNLTKGRGITKTFGAKASNVKKALFKKNHDKKPKPDSEPVSAQISLRASMLAIVMVHKQHFNIVQYLMDTVNSSKLEELMEELFDVYEGHNQTIRLFKYLLELDLQNQTSASNTLFRSTTPFTIFMGLIFKKYGIYFLQTSLLANIKKIVANFQHFEVFISF